METRWDAPWPRRSVTTVDWWQEALRSVVEGRRIVLAGAVPPAWAPTVAALQDAGASAVLIVATEGPGVGPAPAVPTQVESPPSGSPVMARLRFALDALRRPTPAMAAAIDAFDPDGSALVIGTFLVDVPAVHGRRCLAHRHPEWLALEDKTVVDALWDRAGVPRLRAVVVPVAEAADAAATLDEGRGTVWSGDARDGFHGGATLVRWVVDTATADRATAILAAHCDRVRIMPFVEGVPCSIHGIVLPEGTVSLRPVEMVVLRRDHEFVYAGCSSFWDPSPGARDAMRAVARAVGERLRVEVGFRGTFTVDGVVDGDDFWPTELNPRFGAGINVVARGIGAPLTLVNDLVVAGVPLGASAAALEAELLAAADAHRAGGTWRVAGGETAADGDPLVLDGGSFRWAAAGEDPHADLHAAPGFVRAVFAPAHTPVGPSVGPRACAFWSFADRELGAGVGPLEPSGG